MKKSIVAAMAVVALAVAVTLAPAQTSIIDVDFETDVSSQFTVRGDDLGNGNDYLANFTYDYSTWSAAAGQTGPASIPQSPNSTGLGTQALYLAVNNQDTTAAAAAVSVFANAASGSSNYLMKFDMWMSYNGGELGATGSTEFTQIGGHSNGSQAEWGSGAAGSGFVMGWTADGGSGTDYRYYEETGGGSHVANHTLPSWNSDGEVNALGDWLTIFTNPPYKRAGSPGHAWTVVELRVQSASVSVFITPATAARQQVCNFTTGSVATSGYPSVGYTDLFSGIENPTGDNFVLIDNFSIIEDPTAVSEWDKY